MANQAALAQRPDMHTGKGSNMIITDVLVSKVEISWVCYRCHKGHIDFATMPESLLKKSKIGVELVCEACKSTMAVRLLRDGNVYPNCARVRWERASN